MHIPPEWKINPIDPKGYFSTVDFQDEDGSSLEIRASCFSPSSISVAEAAYNKLNELNQTGNYRKTCFMQNEAGTACFIEPAHSEFESGRYVWIADLQGQDLAADIEILAKHSNSQLRNQLLAVFTSIHPLEEKSEAGFKCTTTANWL